MMTIEDMQACERAGWTRGEIAAALGVSASAVSRRLNGAGFVKDVARSKRKQHPMRRQIQPLYDDGLTDQDIAARLGISKSTVYLWRTERDLPPHGVRRARSPHPLAGAVLALRKRGFTFDDCAAALGVSRGVVAGICHRNKG